MSDGYNIGNVADYWRGRDPDGSTDKHIVGWYKPTPPERWWNVDIADVFGFATPFDVAVAAIDMRLRPPLTVPCRALVLGAYGFPPEMLRRPLGLETNTDVRSAQLRSLEWFATDIPFLLWAHKVNPFFVKFGSRTDAVDAVRLRSVIEDDPLRFRGVSHLSKATRRAVLLRTMPARLDLVLTPEGGTSEASAENP